MSQEWSLFTEPGEFFDLLSQLETSIAERQGMRRGWFTYTDLCVLLEQAAWRHALTAIYQQFTKVSCMLGLVYLTSVASLLATDAALHQLSLPHDGHPHPLGPPPAPIGPPTQLPAPGTSPVPVDPPAPPARRAPCCFHGNGSRPDPASPTTATTTLPPAPLPAAPVQTSMLCLWGSLLASLGHIHPEPNPPRPWSAAALFCPGCLASHPTLQCSRNTSTTTAPVAATDEHPPPRSHGNHRHGTSGPWLGSVLAGVNSGSSPPLRVTASHPRSILPLDKAQAILMTG
ncbi:hypothetical protein CRUP_004205 [Coryphaenoides rupestris]|nr:hypothetical protein CRUP_004205 [Coryphaenoides rupestris]